MANPARLGQPCTSSFPRQTGDLPGFTKLVGRDRQNILQLCPEVKLSVTNLTYLAGLGEIDGNRRKKFLVVAAAISSGATGLRLASTSAV
jgi:hypothetical protein